MCHGRKFFLASPYSEEKCVGLEGGGGSKTPRKKEETDALAQAFLLFVFSVHAQ